MQFFPRDKGKMTFFEKVFLENGLLKTNSCLSRLIKILYLRGEKLLAKRHFCKPFKLDRVSFSTPENRMSQGVENRGSLIKVP